MLKDLLKFKSGKSLDIKFPIKLEDSNGNITYFEDSNGHWSKREFDSNGNRIYLEKSNGHWSKREFDSNQNQTYFEDSTGSWYKREFDSNGNQTYFENSNGLITDNRPKEIKELSVEEIQEKLGFKIKIVEK